MVYERNMNEWLREGSMKKLDHISRDFNSISSKWKNIFIYVFGKNNYNHYYY